MRIAVAHNYYGDYATGGEGVVFEREVEALRAAGNDVETLIHANAELRSLPLLKRVKFALSFARSEACYQEAKALFRRFKPEILHVHNYKYVLSPAIFQAAKDEGVKTALTLHNYRLAAPCGQLARNARPCEECVGRAPIAALWRSGCASSFSTRALQFAYYQQTKSEVLKNVDAFIALTEFAKRIFSRAGIPEERTYVKPNSCEDLLKGETAAPRVRGADAVFLGRLSKEKGTRFMLDAWRDVSFSLVVVGTGPEERLARQIAPSNVRFVGKLARSEALLVLKRARALIMPSAWCEGLPMAFIEACSAGVPIVASNLGDRAETIPRYSAGALYDVGDRSGFVEATKLILGDEATNERCGRGARLMYEELYEPRKNLEALLEIYRAALEQSSARRVQLLN